MQYKSLHSAKNGKVLTRARVEEDRLTVASSYVSNQEAKAKTTATAGKSIEPERSLVRTIDYGCGSTRPASAVVSVDNDRISVRQAA